MREIFEQLGKITRETINSAIILKNIDKIDASFTTVYQESAGKEHYRLLSYISELTDGSYILDVGTYQGYSAIALSHNQNNKVVSYDVSKQHKQENIQNIDFRIGEATEFENYKNTTVILLDTYHDGIYEAKFIVHLREIKWAGILIMDDINEFPKLREIFDELPEIKCDITHVGHWSGTGIVLFEG